MRIYNWQEIYIPYRYRMLFRDQINDFIWINICNVDRKVLRHENGIPHLVDRHTYTSTVGYSDQSLTSANDL